MATKERGYKLNYTQAEMNGINVREFLDVEFYATLLRKYPNVKVHSISFVIGDNDSATIFHSNKESEARTQLPSTDHHLTYLAGLPK
jgi:hypothetical protein